MWTYTRALMVFSSTTGFCGDTVFLTSSLVLFQSDADVEGGTLVLLLRETDGAGLQKYKTRHKALIDVNGGIHGLKRIETGETHTCTWLSQPLGASSRRACPWWGSASGVRLPSSTPTLYWTVPQWSQNCLVSLPLSDIPRISELCLQEPMITTSFFKCPHGFWFIESDIPLKSCPIFFLLLLTWL